MQGMPWRPFAQKAVVVCAGQAGHSWASGLRCMGAYLMCARPSSCAPLHEPAAPLHQPQCLKGSLFCACMEQKMGGGVMKPN